MVDTTLPNTVLSLIEDSDTSDKPFLKVHHLKMKLTYPDGTESEVFPHDVVERKHLDAVVICPFEVVRSGDANIGTHKTTTSVWIRSCIRPALALREDFPNTSGNQWEFAAGLIEPGESVVEAAQRELMEELGFEVPQDRFQVFMESWGSVGLCGEKLTFVSANVSSFERKEPTEDGSPLERHGKCIKVSLDKAWELGDLKTQAGSSKLKEYLYRLGMYVQ